MTAPKAYWKEANEKAWRNEMKRSEMLEQIVDVITDHIDIENKVYTMAEDILKRIEKKGMRPPLVARWLTRDEYKWEDEKRGGIE